MKMTMELDRRSFIQTAAAGSLVTSLGVASLIAADEKSPAKSKLRKALKFGMIQLPGGSVKDKFALAKEVGFEGLELDSPSNIDRDEAIKARDATGIVIHGVVDSIHWKERLSDANPDVRAKGLEGLKTALRDAKFFGADTVLLVPGKVTNAETENYPQVWERSQAEVRKALPLADELGVKIAIEVVWNDFLTKPAQLVQYIDEFKTPTVGAYFDVSNMVKYGVPPAEWIRQLDKRLLKVDFKGYSKTKNWVPIGEGDEDWPAVLRALAAVGYSGWLTAEVGGGGREKLVDISQRMDRILNIP